jgi:hypothetical protein
MSQRESLLPRAKGGGRREPNVAGAVVGAVVLGAAGIAFAAMAPVRGFAAFGLLIPVIAVVMVVTESNAARRLAAARSDYEERRARLRARIEGGDGAEGPET